MSTINATTIQITTTATSKVSSAEGIHFFKYLVFINQKNYFFVVFGYGTLAIVIVSSLSLLGIFLLPCMNKNIYNKLLVILTGLAVSTLLSDAVLHILPDVCFFFLFYYSLHN